MGEIDPRIERTRRVVLDAVIDELADSGYDGMSVEAVAERAGVSKATVYRHWNGKQGLVCDAVRRIRETIARPESGTMRQQLIALLEALAAKYRDDEATKSMPALISASDRDPSVRHAYLAFLKNVRGLYADIIRDGVAGGEFAPVPDVDMAVSALLGPLIVGRLLDDDRFSPERVPQLVDWILGPPPSSTGPSPPRRKV